MSRTALLAVLALALGAGRLAAQGPDRTEGPGNGPMPGGPPPMHPGGGMHGAGFLLAMTGELGLSDAQVVRLAAISRRAAQRHQAAAQHPPAFTPGQRPSDADMARIRQQHEQMMEQARTDLRDALAVLTADQQARAWEMMMAHHGPGGPGGPGGMMMRHGGPGDMHGPGGPGMMRRGERGPGTPPADNATPPPPRPQG